MKHLLISTILLLSVPAMAKKKVVSPQIDEDFNYAYEHEETEKTDRSLAGSNEDANKSNNKKNDKPQEEEIPQDTRYWKY